MPFRVNEDRSTVHVMVPVEWPMDIHDHCEAHGLPSNTRFIQEAIAAKLATSPGHYDRLIARLDEVCPARNMRPGAFAGTVIDEVR